MSFNEAQTEAIHHKEGPLLIIAGPGSGKTTVIVNRTKNLIEEHHIDPRKILVVTFTKSAAEEMGIRFQKLCLEEEDPDQYTGVHFGTIHSICFQILVSYFGYDYSQLIQENEKYRILYALAKQYDFASLDYNKFIADIAGYVKKYAGLYGILVYSPVIAQAVLESGWGESRLASQYHNYFGLKCGIRWTVETVAKEVIAGKCGNGEDRKKRLQAAGYDYGAVQRKVNELMR